LHPSEQYTTPQVAVLCGRPRHVIVDLLRNGLLSPLPPKFGRYFCWSRQDVARLQRALAARPGRGRPRKIPVERKEVGHA
jgi:hypothetical protein